MSKKNTFLLHQEREKEDRGSLLKMVLDDEDDDSRTLCGRNKKLG